MARVARTAGQREIERRRVGTRIGHLIDEDPTPLGVDERCR